MTIRRRKLTPAVKASIRERQNGLCTWCGDPLSGETDIDHVRPLELGGADAPANMEELHRAPCHREKTKQDARRIAKARRQQRFMAEGRGRKRQGRPLQGRGFSKTLRRKMSGEVVPR